MKRWARLAALLGAGIFGTAAGARADEGMWLYNDLPTAQIQQKYGVTITPAWAEHLQKASVEFIGIASGSFISADGLVMTNHHVGLDTLQNLSDAKHNYARDGFYALTRAEERPAPDLELDTLDSIVPATNRVQAAVTPTMTPAQALLARRSVIAAIEKEAQDKTGLRSEVVALFGGARYDLYRYKRYTDVRLVMAPEQNMAFFGGDPDNFEYPRYDLDMCFFRVYENGKPAKIKDYLRWSREGVQAGEPVFVSGHPGHTSRLDTVADLTLDRDVLLPQALNYLRRREVLLSSWGARLPENARVSKDALFGTQNGRKDLTGALQSLQDPAVIAAKQARQDVLQAKIAADPALQAAYGTAWAQIDAADTAQRSLQKQYGIFGGRGLQSELFGIALTLVRLAEERGKPNGQRLPGFSDANRALLERDLFSPSPISAALERVTLADSLAQMEETLGVNEPLTASALAGQSPQTRALALVSGTKLADVAERRRLADGGLPAIQASTDPMIRLALALDPTLRQIRTQREQSVDSVQEEAYAKIARAELAAGLPGLYPDATDTLRLAYGTVKGYTQDGAAIAPMTTMGGIYPYTAAHDNAPPYQLSPSWVAAKSKIAPNTPYDFVCDADIVGGNSGSPVVNRNNEVVGLIFDGNIQSLSADYYFDDAQNRAVAISSQAIVEALRHIYGDTGLADEIVTGHIN